MGLISKLKDLFNKNIECGIEGDMHIVFPLRKKKYLYEKKNIIVRDDFSCVIVYKGKITDVLNPGKYKINKENLPELFDAANIHKKKGFGAKKIRATVYYVNKREFKDFFFMSDSPFVSKSNEMGKVKGCLQGTCVLKVIDSEQLMRYILSKFTNPKIKGINTLIALLVGNVVNKKIKKLKISPNELLTNAKSLEPVLNTELEDAYDKQGLFVKNIKLKSVNFSKKYKKKVGEYMARHRKMVRSSVNPETRIKPFQYTTTQQPTKTVAVTRTISDNKPTSKVSTAHRPIKSFKVCDRCGAENSLESKICNNCGKNF